MMNNSQTPEARTEGLVIQDMPDEVLVYDLNTNKAHCLNQTAAFVWKSCDGKNSVTDITRLLSKQSGDNINEDLIWLAIDQLNEKSLLEKDIVPAFKGESRRSVIKKIGLAAVIALPVVASLAAPTSVLAVGSCAGCSNANNAAGGNLFCTTNRPSCPINCDGLGVCAQTSP